MSLDQNARGFLEQLMAAAGPAGFEGDVQRMIRDYLAENLPAKRHIEIDRNDNLVAAVRWENRPRVMLMAHVDTVGLIVEQIDSGGFLLVGKIGSPSVESLVGRRVSVLAREGAIPGVIYRLKDGDGKVEVSDLAIDCGFANADEAKQRVRPGDGVCWAYPPVNLAGSRIVGPGTDDRAGVFVATQVLLRVADRSEGPGVVCASVVQEEGPTHMGAVATAGRVRPDLIICIDTAEADDFRGGTRVRLGGGPMIARGGCIHTATSDALIDLAREAGIPHQIEPIGRGTGTDLESAIRFSGGEAIGALLSIPHRHYHSPNEVLDLADVEAAIDLLARFVTDLPEA